ncbi:hypothetical protein BDZ94DRAFT_1199361, partial [Collybia nuda]
MALQTPGVDKRSGGLESLFESIFPGVAHNLAKHPTTPMCHKGTRLAVINDIISWVNDEDRTCRLLWLDGALGVGKSAILQTVVERCAEAGKLGAAFSFSRDSKRRKNARSFSLALSYQLSLAIPALRLDIEKEIKANPHILSKTLAQQIERLVLLPLSQLTELPSMFIAIDGLDECDLPGQVSILELIPTLLSDLPRSFSLLVASRPTTYIREAFDETLQDLSRRVTLDERYAPDKDIEIFLRYKLRGSQGHSTHTWPLDSDMRLLVDACSGQFICAVTIVRYIEGGPHSLEIMLKNLLSTTHSKNASLNPLDNLYIRVLSTYPDSPRLLSVLGILIVSSYQIGLIEALLGLNPGDVTRYLRGLHSLLVLP